IRGEARERMLRALNAEINRLRALQKVNDHVRVEEIEAAEEQVVALATAIDDARLRLDAIRLVVGTKQMP
ncbi:MAG: hypothetical protein HN341_04620, partial [Verrucomicrobia bacterium]|nr:hypothetical protein [Verrucomicrobiota bacterium]